MTTCNLCGKRESRNRPFYDAFVCNQCSDDTNNYTSDGGDITFINSENKKVQITSETELDISIINSLISKSNAKLIDCNNDYKYALMASLYSQMDF